MSKTEKNRAICLIDGFNLYHSLEDSEPENGFPYKKYKWLNLIALVNNFVQPLDELKETYYFTAICNWDKSKANRHYRYIYALQNFGVKVRKGRFRKVERTCRASCKESYKCGEEKRTDVDIAVTLISLAHQNVYDNAYLLTADSDQIPAVEEVKTLFPEKKINLIIPINSKAEELSGICHKSSKIKEVHLYTSQFDLDIKSISGKNISCPHEWR